MATGRFNAGVDSVELLIRQISQDWRPYRDGLVALGALAALRWGYLSSRYLWQMGDRTLRSLWNRPKALDLTDRCGQWAGKRGIVQIVPLETVESMDFGLQC